MQDRLNIQITRNGESLLDWTLVPVFGAEKKVTGLVLTMLNVTERKRGDDEKNRLLKAIASSTDGITICDEKDRYIYVNEAYARIYGYFRNDFIGETWRKITLAI